MEALDAAAAEGVRNIQVQAEFRVGASVFQGNTQTRSESSTVQMLVVSDGLEGKIFIGSQLPYLEWYRNYLQNEGYLTGNIVFRDVGASLVLRPRIVAGRIEVSLTPEISYQTQDGIGAIQVSKLSTTLYAVNGQTLEVGGSTSVSEFGNRFYRTESGQSLRVLVTPRILE